MLHPKLYVPKKDKTSDVFPGFTLSGPIWKDRIFGFIGFNPEWNDLERKVNYDQAGGIGGGIQSFSQNSQTYYTNGRIDAELTKKLRVYGSWLYQYQRQSGEALPFADSSNGLFNVSSTVPAFAYPHSAGYAAPNQTINVGADYSITPRLVLTGRFGYYFENYHDFGLPQTGTLTFWETSGTCTDPSSPDCVVDNTGQPLPSSLAQSAGYFNVANSQNFTVLNANKAIQVDANVAWFKSGWHGTHNFKFGFQLNRLNNDIWQHWNVPEVQYFVGSAASFLLKEIPGLPIASSL